MLPPRSSGSRVLAVPLLGEASGGVGQASSLIWRSFEETWDTDRELVSLLKPGQGLPDGSDKLRYGATLAYRQALGRARWILFAHLGLARVERYLPSRLRAPYAIFVHGIECWGELPESDRTLLREAHARIANSHYTARRTMAAHPDIGPVVSCPLALAPELVPKADQPPAAARAPMVLVVGRMSAGERYKGHDQLIAVWPDVVAVHPQAELMIVGDGDDRPRLEDAARSSVTPDRIRFTGFIERTELEALYARAAAFALPSRGEGFGLVYLEAMAYGLPCIASTDDAGSEVVADGQTGILVDPDDRHQLGASLAALLGDVELRQRMGERGRERVRTAYGFERFRRDIGHLLADTFDPSVAGVSA